MAAHRPTQPLAEPFRGQPDAQAAHVAACQRFGIVGDGARGAGRIVGVRPGNRFEQQRRIADIFGQRADLVERGGESDQAVATDAAIGRLQSDHPAKGRGLPHRAAGVGAERGQAKVRRDRRRRSTARATRHARLVPRVARRPIGRVLGGAAHRELVGVGLAQKDRPRTAQPRHHGAIPRRHIPFKDARTAGGGHALGRKHIFQRDRQPQQCAPLARCQPLVGGSGLLTGQIGALGQVTMKRLIRRHPL